MHDASAPNPSAAIATAGAPAARVAVVTGASSGIGRATALELARRGVAVVVAARRADALDELVREISAGGGQAHAVPTDTSDAAQVDALADAALERFGRLDVWVNNAAVTVFGRFEDVSPEAFRRVVDVDLFGYVHGARAALRIFRGTGAGVLINNASIEGLIASPYQSAYSVAKHGVVALGQSLRQELRDMPDIHVCTLMPAAVDTPFFEHAGNQVGRAPKPPHPVYAPERVAATIADLAERPRREVVFGLPTLGLLALRLVAPGLFERLHARQVEADSFEDSLAPPSDGNLFRPVATGTSPGGGWARTGEGPSQAALVGVLALVAAALAALRLRSRR